MMMLELTEREFDLLLIMAGYATGAAERDGNQQLKWAFVKLLNRLNESNPHWTPYLVPEEFQ
jgi:hypothetical protein